MMRQVAGAFMEYEKGRLVAKLRGARERKRKETGKYSELRGPRCAPPPSRARVGHQPNACNTGVVDRSDDNPENRTPTRQIFSAAWLHVAIGETKVAKVTTQFASPRDLRNSRRFIRSTRSLRRRQ